MRCAHCKAEASAGAVECAVCGVIFAKFLAQRERDKKEAAEFMAVTQAPPAAVMRLWPGRVVASVLLLLWIGGLMWYYVNEMNARDERLQSDLRARSRAAATGASPP